MTDLSDKTCKETVYPNGSFMGHRCGRPAKAVCEIAENMKTGNKIHGFRCGIHAKRYKKVASFQDQ